MIDRKTKHKPAQNHIKVTLFWIRHPSQTEPNRFWILNQNSTTNNVLEVWWWGHEPWVETRVKYYSIYIITTYRGFSATHTHFSLKKMEKNTLHTYKLVLLCACSLVLFLNTELSFLASAKTLDNDSKACNANWHFPIFEHLLNTITVFIIL